MDKARLIRAVALFLFASVIGGVVLTLVLFAWYSRNLPNPGEVVRREGFSTKIMDRNGEVLYDVFGDQRRTPVELDQVPDYLKQATIAIEDKEFYKHEGFDVWGMVRGFSRLFTRGRAQGGSTLTQQLVKNVLLTDERSVARKVKEFVLSVQIERRFTKDQILLMYLNEAPYGGTAWGVASAAEIYFNKSVADLDLAEAAILAGMPQRPSYYSPFGSNPSAYEGRTGDVLRRMREDGYITREQEEEAVGKLPEVEFAERSVGIKAPHFVFYVEQQLEDMFGPALVEQGGLRVTTSLDLPLQQEAQQIVAEEVDKVANLDVGNGAALVMDPETGEILSMVGSKDYFAKDYDGQVNVVTSLRQPGSSIKPVTYALAFEKGYSPAHMLMDVKTEFPGGGSNPTYVPENYDGKFRGFVQLRFALGSSLNIPAVKLLSLVGIRDMLSLAYDMGFESLEPTEENLKRFGLSVTLGGGEVRLLNAVQAYSAFANGGVRVEPVAILKVEDRNGKTLFEHRPVKGKRVLDEKVAFLINHVLSDNNARLLTFGSNSLLNMGGRPIAVKTGTTNDRRDNWTIGWSSSTAVGVWVGNNDNSPMKGVASGVTGASPIWRRIMLRALEDRPARAFAVPNGVEATFVDQVSGYPEHDGFPARSEYVIRGTLPSLPDAIHTKLKLCNGENKLAAPGQIAENNYYEKEYFVFRENDPFAGVGGENKWQKGIDEWVATQGDEKYHPPTDKCTGTGQDVVVRVKHPENYHDYDGDKIEVDVDVFADKSIKNVEIIVGDALKERLSDKPYKTTLTLAPGVYVLKARAVFSDDSSVVSGETTFGMGGVSSTATPTPTPAPSPTPTAGP